VPVYRKLLFADLEWIALRRALVLRSGINQSAGYRGMLARTQYRLCLTALFHVLAG
jgi:hypothetical protein